MNRPRIWRWVAAVLMLCASVAHGAEVLRWERLPLTVPLVIGQERVILLDHEVRVGVPASATDRLRVQSASGAVYLLANAALEPTRLQLQDLQTDAVILLDVSAGPAPENQVPLEPVRIVDALAATARGTDDVSSTSDRAGGEAPESHTPVPVVLTRYAAQSLYAPLRTVEPAPGITRTPLSRSLALETLLPMLPVQAQALAAWRRNDHWVSAVRLRNTAATWLALDPRLLQGDFLAATFQHATLGPAGTPEDTTVVYLVTRGHGLANALLPAISPIDTLNHVPAPAAVAPDASRGREK